MIRTSAHGATAVPAVIATEISESAPADYGAVAVLAYLRSSRLIRFFDPNQPCRLAGSRSLVALSGGLLQRRGSVITRGWSHQTAPRISWGHYGGQLGFRADFSILEDRDRERALDFGLI